MRIYTLGAAPMGPPVDPSQPIPAPDVQQQIADVWDSLFKLQDTVAAGAAAPAPTSSAPESFSAWLDTHQTAVLAGVGGVLFLALFTQGGGGRR
jgi:hypothetical protein